MDFTDGKLVKYLLPSNVDQIHLPAKKFYHTKPTFSLQSFTDESVSIE